MCGVLNIMWWWVLVYRFSYKNARGGAYGGVSAIDVVVVVRYCSGVVIVWWWVMVNIFECRDTEEVQVLVMAGYGECDSDGALDTVVMPVVCVDLRW